MKRAFWKDKRVLITGHTGFKGSWLCAWLISCGAEVYGYSLSPAGEYPLYRILGLEENVHSVYADISEYETLRSFFRDARPEVVFHLAAQPIVRESYADPLGTYRTNVMGTVHMLECVRACGSVKAVVNVTTDKVYENKEWLWGYRENEVLNGCDPYSNSKSCSDLITSSYVKSFFSADGCPAVATARAGNVIGGGDRAADRLIPDCVRACESGKRITVRNPGSIRPWQHVLEPLCGYLTLAERLYTKGREFCGGWNFGPEPGDCIPVENMVGLFCGAWGGNAGYASAGGGPHEAKYLMLDCSKAKRLLGWQPVWNVETAVARTAEWHRRFAEGADMLRFTLGQIDEYESGLSNTIADNTIADNTIVDNMIVR